MCYEEKGFGRVKRPRNDFAGSTLSTAEGFFFRPFGFLPIFPCFGNTAPDVSNDPVERRLFRPTRIRNTRVASREACRRAAAFPSQAAYRPTSLRAPRTEMGAGHRPARPASRGTCRVTAVKPWPSRMSLYAPARHRRAVRGQGALPLGLEVKVGDQLGVLLDELLAGIHLLTHEQRHGLVRRHGVLYRDLHHGAGLRVHGGLPELLGAHFA